MKPVLKFLSDEEIQTLHQASLKILSEFGIQIPSEDALNIMQEAGAEITGENIVKIPPHLVELAISTVPKRNEVTLYGRDPENDISFEKDSPVIACMTEATQIIDPYTRQKRPATCGDLVKLTKFVNHLENVKINSALVTPQDVEGEISDWFSWAISIKNTTKHITGAAAGVSGVRDTIRMACAAVGGEENFRQRPFLSFWVLTRPPLQIGRLTVEALIEMSKWKVPAIISSGPILGITAPVTLAGMIAQAHAEILACIVLTQLVNPGAPVVYTSFARSMDMKSGSVSMSSPEFAMLKGSMAQMGRSLGLPVRMPAMLRDAKILDAQAGFETGMTGTVSALTADIIDGMQFDMDIVVDYADLLFSNEAMGAFKRLSREVKVDDSTIAMEVIEKVGHGGNFLKEKHTFSNFRKELWQPKMLERRGWAAWEKDGGQDITTIAAQKALALLESQSAELMLSPEVEAEIDKIVEEAQVDYSKSI